MWLLSDSWPWVAVGTEALLLCLCVALRAHRCLHGAQSLAVVPRCCHPSAVQLGQLWCSLLAPVQERGWCPTSGLRVLSNVPV